MEHVIKKYGAIFALLIIGVGSFISPSLSRADENVEKVIKTLLTSESVDERLSACKLLETLSLSDAAILPALVQALGNDASAQVRREIALLLGKFGDASILPVLLSAITKEEAFLHQALWTAVFRILEQCEKSEKIKIENAIITFLKNDKIDAGIHVGYIESLAPSVFREQIFKVLLQEENEKVVEVNDRIIKQTIESLVEFHIEKTKRDGKGWFHDVEQFIGQKSVEYTGISLGLLALLSTRKLSLESSLAKKRDDAIQNFFSMLVEKYNSFPDSIPIHDSIHKIWLDLYTLSVVAVLKREPLDDIDMEMLNLLTDKIITHLLTSQSPKNGGWSYLSKALPEFDGAETSFTTAAVLLALELSGVGRDDVKKAKEKAVQFLYRLIVSAREVHYFDPEFAEHFIKNEKLKGVPTPRGSAGRSVVSQLAVFFSKDQPKKMEFIRKATLSSWQYLDDLRIHIGRDDVHEGQDQLAPYYFYFNLPYLASAISLDSETEFGKQMRDKLLDKLFKMRRGNGFWPNEGPTLESKTQVYPQSMVLIALSALYRGEDASADALVLLPPR